MYQYPFFGCHCQMVINRVPAEDERQLRMLAVFGYSLIRVPRGLGRDKDLVLATLTRRGLGRQQIQQAAEASSRCRASRRLRNGKDVRYSEISKC